ncbi:MAG: hypothetical protein JWN34_5569 [Bryobacterales bacterium]|nr:hypothetical protein [Bryobacterales bacterium]
MKTALVVISGLIFCARILSAQEPAFEVASVKVTDPKSHVIMRTGFPSPRTFEATGSLRELVKVAYKLDDLQVSGGERWMSNDRFDITGRAAAPAGLEEMRAMLRQLLKERFGLVIRIERRLHEVYVLRLDKGGHKLKPATDDVGSISTGHDFIRASIGMEGLARALTSYAGRMVTDETGIAGDFKVELRWGLDEQSTLPSFFTAVREQLGLRLEGAERPLESVMIVRAVRPEKD